MDDDFWNHDQDEANIYEAWTSLNLSEFGVWIVIFILPDVAGDLETREGSKGDKYIILRRSLVKVLIINFLDKWNDCLLTVRC